MKGISCSVSGDGYLTGCCAGRIWQSKLKYLRFGSADSKDVDVVVKVPAWFTNETVSVHDMNFFCQMLDTVLLDVFDVTNMPINSCLARWEKGKIVWCQKGTEADLNNCLMQTFSKHKQMYDKCPIFCRMEIDPITKLVSTVRETLCKMTKCVYIKDEKSLLLFHLQSVFSIPEIEQKSEAELRTFCLNVFPNMLMPKSLYQECLEKIEGASSWEKYLASKKKSSDYLKKMDDIVKAVKTKDEQKRNDLFVIQIDQNIQFTDDMVSVLKQTVPFEKLDVFIRGNVLCLNRLLRHVRGHNHLGIRTDFLKTITFSEIQLRSDDTVSSEDTWKDIAFKWGQCKAFAEGKEVFEKSTNAEYNPEISNFLLRKPLSKGDFDALNRLCLEVLNILEKHPSYRRDLQEQYN